jgi:inosine-uridine nucleoside N-ribohydrolase
MKTKLLIIFLLFSIILNAQIRNVIIDADTDNELDDLLAIAAALKSDKLEVIGLTAAQWAGRYQKKGEENHPLSVRYNSAYSSWLLNVIILQMMDREEIHALKGSEKRVFYERGRQNNESRKNEASEFIIEKALELPENEKLTIISTGAITNVASAVMLRPEIAKKISLFWLGQTYDFDKNLWTGEREFNLANDPDAFDVLCDAADLEFHIMPNNVSGLLRSHNESSIARLEGEKGIGAFIRERWRDPHYSGTKDGYWTMWDVALIYAVTNPEWASEKMVNTPPGTVNRKVSVYTDIDAKKMEEEFWNNFLKW